MSLSGTPTYGLTYMYMSLCSTMSLLAFTPRTWLVAWWESQGAVKQLFLVWIAFLVPSTSRTDPSGKWTRSSANECTGLAVVESWHKCGNALSFKSLVFGEGRTGSGQLVLCISFSVLFHKKLCDGAQMAIFGNFFASWVFSKPRAARFRPAF